MRQPLAVASLTTALFLAGALMGYVLGTVEARARETVTPDAVHCTLDDFVPTEADVAYGRVWKGLCVHTPVLLREHD